MGTARFKYLVKIQMFDRYFDIERKFKYLVIIQRLFDHHIFYEYSNIESYL